MPVLQLGSSAFDRDRGNFPAFPLINMIAESVPFEEQPILQSRPGLASVSSMGTGPIRQLFNKDGILGAGLFGLSGNTLYTSSTAIGPIDGTDYVSMDGFETTLFVSAGKRLWSYNGTRLAPVTLPDAFEVLQFVIGTSRLILIKKNTGRIYWSDPLTSTVNALSFATAENSPDRLKHLLFDGDKLILFGAETVEFWIASGANPDLPYQPIIGRTLSIGVRDTGCATLFNGSFAWITNNNQIYFGDQRTNLSNPSLDEKMSNSVTAKLWTFRLEGVEYLAVTLDDQTWALSSKTSRWSTFESYGEVNWVPNCAAGDYFGSSTDGKLIQWSSDHSDFGGVLERRFRAGAPVNSGTVPLHQITLLTNPGQTPFLGKSADPVFDPKYFDPVYFDTIAPVIKTPYSNPTVGMRLTRDGGFTWTPYYDRQLGEQGHFHTKPQWRSMGLARVPGLIVEFRVTDPVPFRVSNVLLNESYEDINE